MSFLREKNACLIDSPTPRVEEDYEGGIREACFVGRQFGRRRHDTNAGFAVSPPRGRGFSVLLESLVKLIRTQFARGASWLPDKRA